MDLKDFDKRVLEKIYHNGFSKIPKSKSQATMRKGGVDMRFNSYGFRTSEFINNVDFLFSGCSVTEGWGLSEENLWTNRLMTNLSGSHTSVAKAGDSINGQIKKIFAYINNYGNPKNIICLFPQFDRVQVFINKELFATEPFFRAYNKQAFESDEYINSLYIDASVALTSQTQNKKEYFKRPLLAEDVIPTEMSHMYSAQSIHMLSQYCKEANINFLWATWSEDTNNIVKQMKYNNFFLEHIDIHENTWEYSHELNIDICKNIEGDILNCHLDSSDSPEFHLALDIQNGTHNAHFGSHRHLHYYESFLKHIKGLL